MVQNTRALEHVILLLKSIKSGLRPVLRIAVATIWQMERLLPQASWAHPSSAGPDSNLSRVDIILSPHLLRGFLNAGAAPPHLGAKYLGFFLSQTPNETK